MTQKSYFKCSLCIAGIFKTKTTVASNKQTSKTGPAYNNAKHLLAFLSCLLVFHSRSRGRSRGRQPTQSYFNIWNSVSTSSAAPKPSDSPVYFLKLVLHFIKKNLLCFFLSCKGERCWTKISVTPQTHLKALLEALWTQRVGLLPRAFLLLLLLLAVWPRPTLSLIQTTGVTQPRGGMLERSI